MRCVHVANSHSTGTKLVVIRHPILPMLHPLGFFCLHPSSVNFHQTHLFSVHNNSIISHKLAKSNMGRIFKKFLPNSTRIYSCAGCDADISGEEHIISKSFQGRLGRGFLFEKVVNVYRGQVENRLLNTGVHTVADVHCTVCTSLVGWIYLEAKEESQKYKEGRFLLEKKCLSKRGDW